MNRRLLVAAAVSGLGLSLPAADLVYSVTTNETDHTVTVDVSGGTYTLTEPYGAETLKLIKTGTGTVQYTPTGETPYGELDIQKGQFIVKDVRHVGVGPIVTAGDGTLLFCDVDAVVTQKVTFGGTAGRVAGYTDKSATGAGSVTLTSVKSTEKVNGFNRVLVGRSSNSAYAKACLSLTGADSEPFDRLDVDGNTQVTFDDGTIQVPATAANPFVRLTATGTDKTFVVGPRGVAFDTAEGVDVSLGVSPTFAGAMKVTNYVSSVEIEKGSFEGSTTSAATNGWNSTVNEWDEKSQRGKNTEAFVTATRDGVTRNWTTPFGDYYYHLRRGATLSREVPVSEAGLWRLSFWSGCRPPNNSSTGYSQKITTTVLIDETVVLTIPAVTSMDDLYPFKEFKTEAVPLTAGTHTIKLVHSGSCPTSSGGKNYDYFVLERCEESTVDGGFVKKGVGRLTVDDITTPSPVTVSAGSLFLAGTTLDDAVATVADGAKLELAAPTLTDGAKVTVVAGGTLVLRDDSDNLVANGSFETPTTENYSTKFSSDWTRSLTDEPSAQHGNKDGAGIRSDSSTAMTAPENAPDGTQVAYLRNYTKIAQTLKVDRTGAYRLSFSQSVRSGSSFKGSYTKLCMHARIDGSEILSAGPFPDEPEYAYKSFERIVQLEAGEHVLSFDVTGDSTTSGIMLYLDAVKLVPYVGVRDIDVGELHLASGSTLKLDYDGKMHVQNVFVDDVKVNGGKSALVNAGVMVSGPGRLSVGDKLGGLILMR